MASLTQGRQDREVGRPVKSWKLIPPSEGWMCEGNDVEEKRVSEEEVEKNEDANGIEEGAVPRAMDVDADEDYLQYLEELRHHPEYSPAHSSQAFAQYPSDDAQSLPSDARSQPSFDLSGIRPTPVGPNQ
ncbi:hypothetical protein PIB30_088056 [Stylosanthes scabra]|uniref:Uncharacterized protein n=1 Tax=Stylosanthes scabra TaxID=79078 RepID=A0ABU6STW3_9FABA|nr:hypothetical protein [Stylosanthes scabra]